MALPVGIDVAVVTFGQAVSYGGRTTSARLVVKPSASLVYNGIPILDFPEAAVAGDGQPGQIFLPVCDQPGFKATQNGVVVDFTGWSYTATLTWLESVTRETRQVTKVFQVLTGQATIDFDDLPDTVNALPVTAPVSGVTSFLGKTGPITEADLADLDLGGGPGATNSGVAAFVTEAGDTKTALDNTYAPVDDPRFEAAAVSGPEATGAVQLATYAYRQVSGVYADPDGWAVQALSPDGRIIIGCKVMSVGVSYDDGTTFSLVRTFDQDVRGVFYLANGEILVSIGASSGTRSELWRTAGWAASPATATWDRVRQAPTNVLNVYPYTMYSGLTRDEASNVYAADYGGKTNTRPTADLGAVRLLHSADNGGTWREIFRLDQWLTGRGIDPMSAGYHLHGCVWDTYWDRLWLTFGDYYSASVGEAGVLYCDNPTAATPTWNVAYLVSEQVTENGTQPQGVALVAARDSIIIQPDGVPAAIFRIPREGYRVMGELEEVYRVRKLDGAVATSAAAIGGMPFQAAYPGAPILLPLGHQQNTQGNLSRLVATADGTTFTEIARDTSGAVANFAGYTWVVGPLPSGKILLSSISDGRFGGNRTTLRLPDVFGASIPASLPGAGAGLAAGLATGTTQALTGTAEAGAVGYIFEVKPTSGGDWKFAGVSATPAATVTGLSPTTSYDYRFAPYGPGGRGAWSSVVTASTGTSVTTYFEDNFTRADGPLGSTPVGAKAYAFPGLPAPTGVGVINGNKAQIYSDNAAFHWRYVNAGSADGVLRATLTTKGAASLMAVAARFQSPDNTLVLQRVSSAAPNWKLLKRVAAVSTDLYVTSVPIADGSALELHMVGTTLTLWINGTNLWTGTVTELAANDGFALGGFNTASDARWGNWSFKSA